MRVRCTSLLSHVPPSTMVVPVGEFANIPVFPPNQPTTQTNSVNSNINNYPNINTGGRSPTTNGCNTYETNIPFCRKLLHSLYNIQKMGGGGHIQLSSP